jgi:hypothetical protein
MIKFFRKIRQKLLQEGLPAGQAGKTSQYLKYAIGEILLVVIGILIALQVNTWNEGRKEQIAEKDFYCKLLEDFELDRQNIARLTKESDYKIETSKKLLLELPQKNKSKAYLIDNYNQALRTNAFAPSKVAITDITSSGKLSLIKNNALKQNLLRYYSELDNLLFQLDLNRNKSLERAFAYDDEIAIGFHESDYAKKALGSEILATFPKNDWHLDLDSKYYKQFRNDLVIFVQMSDREKQHFTKILKEMEVVYHQLKELCK